MMSRVGIVGLVTVAAMTMACASSSPGSEVEADDELRSTERGFEYDCQAPQSGTVLPRASTKLLVTDGHLRFEGEYGPNLGARDRTYRQPSGTSRARYEGFETGDDCTLKVVSDQALLKGEATGQLRIQCSGDDFRQDLLTCTGPKAATLRLPRPPAPPPVRPSVPANAKKWKCTMAESYALLATTVTLQVNDGAIRVVADDDEYTGVRDRAYRARTGNWMSYEDVEYGGDCSLSLIVDANVLTSGTTTTTLKARCAGDGFQEDRYTCVPNR